MKLQEYSLLYIDARFRAEPIFHTLLPSMPVIHLPAGYQYGCSVLPD